MPKVDKVEMTVIIDETELLRFLLERYNQEDLLKMGVLPETSVIRGMAVEQDGKCSFRVCALSFTNPERLVQKVEDSETLKEPLSIEYECPHKKVRVKK